MKGNSKSTYPSGLLQRSNFVLNPSRTKPHPKPTSFFPHPQPFKRQNLQAPIYYNQLSLSLSVKNLSEISLSLSLQKEKKGKLWFLSLLLLSLQSPLFCSQNISFFTNILVGVSWKLKLCLCLSLCVETQKGIAKKKGFFFFFNNYGDHYWVHWNCSRLPRQYKCGCGRSAEAPKPSC